jgi:hypothetical protein
LCVGIKKGTHNYQALARKLFKDVFDIEQDEDFLNHKSASPEQVQAFVDDSSGGPDSDDLHFDMIGPYNNVWNRRVIAALAEKFEEKRQAQPKHLRLPQRPVEYVEQLLVKRFERCRTHWLNQKPRVTDGGIKETQEQVEIRVNNAKRMERKNARHTTRRRNVGRILSWTRCIC